MIARNTYYVCLGKNKEPIPWDPHDESQKINIHTDYFGKALVSMEEELESQGWIIYLTWDLRKLPSYGDNVIVILLGDERARIPCYSKRVRAIFKCYGIRPRLGCNPLARPSYQNWLTWIQYVHSIAQFIPGWIYWKMPLQRTSTRNSFRAPIYAIPLGYANQREVPFIPFEERQYDISFAGSVVHKPYAWWSPKRWFLTPKSYSRRKMLKALQRVKRNRKAISVDLKITSSYSEIRTADPVEYSNRVMNTRISLVPRGASYETFRFFEALRVGCVIFSEYLPPHWFYNDSPVIHVSDWQNLQEMIDSLYSDPEKLRCMHEASLEWWNSVCSEHALGCFMADKINSMSVVPTLK